MKAEAIVGESPLWSPHERVLYWVDITGQKIHRFNPRAAVNDTSHLPQQPVTSVGLREKGGLVITLRKDFAFFNPETGDLKLLSDPEEDKPYDRFNDAKCDRQGRFWAGTMDDVKWNAPHGSLYRLDPDTKVTCMKTSVICANGLGWSPDNRVFYFTESFRHGIYAYNFDPSNGNISKRCLFASIDRNSDGFPDGLTVDEEGYVWSVHNVVGLVVRYSPSGAIDCVIEIPVPRPTSCIFGGDELDVLYITSARETMTPEEIAQAPLSGSLFAVKPGVKGLLEPYFTG